MKLRATSDNHTASSSSSSHRAAALALAASLGAAGACSSDPPEQATSVEAPVVEAEEPLGCVTLTDDAVSMAMIAYSPMDPAEATRVFGDPPQMTVGYIGPEERRVLLRFSVDALPPSGVITSATLLLRAAASPGAHPVDVRASLSPWNPQTVTWAERSRARGGSSGPILTSIPTVLVPDQTISADLPAATVQSWLAGNNYGLVLQHPLSGRTTVDTMTANRPTLRPALRVCYCEPSPEVCDGVDNDCDGVVDEGVSCDDGDACTTDSCQAGACAHQAISCDDGDACTKDGCSAEAGCYSIFVPGPSCNLCLQGGPDGGPLSCDDGNECTIDACDGVLGCKHFPAEVGAACHTQLGAGVCSAGACVDAPPCGDGVCAYALGETCASCAQDCWGVMLCSDSCGDGVCDAENGECVMCASDCSADECPDHCGDGICQPAYGETPKSCEADCAPSANTPD